MTAPFDGIDRAALLDTFLAQAREQLDAMETNLMALEARPGDVEPLHAIFRAAHTLKGDAGIVGLDAAAELADAMEDVLARLRGGALPVTGARITLLLGATDTLRASLFVGARAESRADRPAHVLEALRGDVAGAADALPATTTAESAPRPEPGAARPAPARTLRVTVAKLDQLLNLAAELLLERGRMVELLKSVPGCAGSAVLEVHRDADRLFQQLQDFVMSIRMVPLAPLFRQSARVVRDTAQNLGKDAELVLEGEDVEVDTTVAEALRETLLHLVRNAVDHGIEMPKERSARGKPAAGRVTLGARRDGGQIVVRLADDGAGLDRTRIADRARARGVANVESLDDADLFALVFEPGFSTASVVTDVSGRGVGLDVVKRNVEALRGSVSISGGQGRGTTVTLRLPLTLAIIDGFGVGVAGETYVLPLDGVVECVELPAAHRTHGGATGMMELRGRPLPYVRLRRHFGISAEPAPRESIVVVRYAGGEAGLAVDTLLGDSRTVITPLPVELRGARGLSGSAILGTGRVAFVLDVAAVLEGTSPLGRVPTCVA